MAQDEGQPVDEPPHFIGIEPPEELLELADGVRRVIDTMVRIDESHPELVSIGAEVEDVVRRLGAIARKGDLPRMLPHVEPGPDDLRPYYPSDARRWHVNPMHPPLEFTIDEGVMRGSVTLGLAWEGPPGCVHGGFVAMLLDQLLGHANQANRLPALTGELRVRYHRPTPLHQPLDFEVGRPERVSERRLVARARLRAGDVTTAEAEGTFILPNPATVESDLHGVHDRGLGRRNQGEAS